MQYCSALVGNSFRLLRFCQIMIRISIFICSRIRLVSVGVCLMIVVGLVTVMDTSTGKAVIERFAGRGDDCRDFLTTCGCQADRRGLHQKVIAYSLYGNFSDSSTFNRYLAPMERILATVARAYPGWAVRIYSPIEDSDSWRKLKEFFDGYSFVDVCNVTRVLEIHGVRHSLFPMTWRFLPLIDVAVDRFMSRDTDSLVLPREVDAVHEWLSSTATFHIMRDNKEHCVPMLGGLWGAKTNQRRPEIFQAVGKILFTPLKESDMAKGIDQSLLSQHLWSVATGDEMSHDSYCCQHFPSARPFPTQRQGPDFVGEVFTTVTNRTAAMCPEQCRPKQHPNWLYC